MQLDDHYIRFRFVSTMNRGKDKPYNVYANNMDEMNMFLTQHCFKNVDNTALEIIPKDKCKNRDDVLELFSFKSNHSDDVYRVMTTRNFVDKAMDDTSTDLNYTLLFGEAILRSDIEIFKHIHDLLFDLSHVHVKDVLIADDNCINKCGYIKDEIDMRRRYMDSAELPYNDYDSRLVLESLFDSLNNEPGEIYPITIEAYVSCFTTLLTDTYNT